MNRKRISVICILLCNLWINFFFVSCTQKVESKAAFVFGTVCNIRLYDKTKGDILTKVFKRLNEIESIFSVTIEESEVSKINGNAGIAPVSVSLELVSVLKTALDIAALSEGAFNPAIGPLSQLWGLGTQSADDGREPRVPSTAEIDAAIILCDWQKIELDEKNSAVFLPLKGMALDLGGIAKGYAADEAARMLHEEGIKRAIIDLGGNIIALGNKSDGRIFKKEETLWRVGIQDPSEKHGVYAKEIECKDATLVTSGDYERFVEIDGKRYHHILSAWTGFPVDNELRSVTIIADNKNSFASTKADALSTALFALGYE
jgi:thiamine biosynthesis lipoprotein